MKLRYWLNMETDKVLASEEPPYGKRWVEITKTEYETFCNPLTYTQEFDEFSDADPGL